MNWKTRLLAALEENLNSSPEEYPKGQQGIAAVLVLLTDKADHPEILLTKRTNDVQTHKGQISFPGGFFEPQDGDLLQTALRETKEEVGITKDQINIFGQLTPIHTLGKVEIFPFLGLLTKERTLTPNPTEVDKIIWLPTNKLKETGVHKVELELHGNKITNQGLYHEGELIWGATAKILQELWRLLL